MKPLIRILAVSYVIGVAPGLKAAILSLRVNDVIQPVVAGYVIKGISQAEREGATAVIIRLNTPGGLDQSMREIISSILTAKVPVISFVGPSGARAASAGFFILLSSDLAVMAPGTNTGAAHPVSITGGRFDEVMSKKVENDAAAYLRSIVAKRGRNSQMAERGVVESKSFTESEALANHLIDGIAKDYEEILLKFDGKEISRFNGEKVILKLKGETFRELQMTLRQKVLTEVLNPNIALVLGLIGLLGLYVEFTSPGVVLPGIIGGVCLFLALVAFNLLPVNFLGIALLATAIVLFIVEAKVASYGVLAALGIVSMILGSLILIDSPLPELRVHLATALGVTLPFAGITIFLLRLVLLSRRAKSVTGAEGMIGAVGLTLSDTFSEGKIQVHGEIWRARSSQPIPVGEKVRVTAIEGLTLIVARI
jgi:membrane-bound serine protease (ClpP class)